MINFKLVYFILLLVFSIPAAFAQVEQGSNYDKIITGEISPEGLPVYKNILYPKDRVFDGSAWVKKIVENNQNSLNFKSGYIDFQLDKNDCSFSLYNPVTQELDVRKYYSDLEIDLEKKQRLCNIENLIQHDNGLNFTLNQGEFKTHYYLDKHQGLELTYEFDNNEGKTSTFEITETCEDCNPKIISENILKFGSYEYDTKNIIHGTFKEARQELDDFKISYEKTLTQKEKGIIDPTFGWTGEDLVYRIYDIASISGSCNATVATKDSNIASLQWTASGSNGRCQDYIAQWDTTSIGDGSTISNVRFRIDFDSQGGSPDCQIYQMPNEFSTRTDQQLWDDITTGNQYVSTWTACQTTGNQKTIDLGSTADTDLQSQLGDDFFAIVLTKDPRNREATTHSIGVSDGELEVTYTSGDVWSPGPPINPDATEHIQHIINFTWTPNNATGVTGYAVFNASTQAAPDWDWTWIGNTGNYTGSIGNFTIRNLSFCEDMWLKTSAFSLNNGTNTTGVYGKSRCGPPNAVETITSPEQTFFTIILNWILPALNGGVLDGYQINFTTPQGDPVSIIENNTKSSAVSYEITGLNYGTEYSFRVSPWTEGGNNATGLILNASTLGTVGNFTLNYTNTNLVDFRFNETNINSSAKNLEVIYPNTFENVRCNFYFNLALVNQSYGNLDSSFYDTNYNSTDFLFVNSTNDIIDVYCFDETLGNNGTYKIELTDIPMITQILNFQAGEYGTAGDFGLIDVSVLFILIVSMIGFNRFNETVGAIFAFMLIGALGWFGIIQFPTIIFGAVAVVLMLTIASTRKD